MGNACKQLFMYVIFGHGITSIQKSHRLLLETPPNIPRIFSNGVAIGCAPLLDRVHFGTWWNRGWGKNIQDEFKEFLMVGWLVYTQLWMAYWFLMIYEFLHYYSLQGIWATSYDDLQSAWETFAKMMPMYWFQVLKFSVVLQFGLIVMTDIPNDGHVGIPAISKYFKPQRSSTKDQQKQGLIKIQKMISKSQRFMRFLQVFTCFTPCFPTLPVLATRRPMDMFGDRDHLLGSTGTLPSLWNNRYVGISPKKFRYIHWHISMDWFKGKS